MLGNNASYEFRWRRWALLRDVVITHLDSESEHYRQFTSIGNALGTPSVRIPAAALASELEAIRAALTTRSVDELVISPTTASVLYPTVRLEEPRRMTRTELLQVAPIGDEKTLAEYFASMIDSMLHVCANPSADGMIEVVDG